LRRVFDKSFLFEEVITFTFERLVVANLRCLEVLSGFSVFASLIAVFLSSSLSLGD
jgi:hypothetical protein